MRMRLVLHVSAGLTAFTLFTMLFTQSGQCQTERGANSTSPVKPVHGATVPDSEQSDSYTIGENDVLAISVWNEKDMQQSVPVRPDGRISLPLIGDIQAAGRTPVQLQADIATKLQSYITHPDVTVIVQQINSKKYNILGRVLKPGSYPLSRTTTVLDAIAQAGGFQDFAKQKSIYILRDKSGAGESRLPFNYKDVIKGKHTDQNINLEPNDTIVVP
jgi:polysaccharide export outer membrane protein